MASKKKSKAVLEAENKFLRTGKLFDNIASVINNFIKYGGLTLMAFYVYKSIAILAGKETNADINIAAVLYTSNTANETSLNWWSIFGIIGFLVGALGALIGFNERRMRQNYIKYRPERYEYLEKKLDPDRSSSQLTSKGDTRPEDK